MGGGVYNRESGRVHGRPWEVEFTIGYITKSGRGHRRPWEVEVSIH